MKQPQKQQQVRQALNDLLDGRLTSVQALAAICTAMGSIDSVTYAKAHTGDRYRLTVGDGRDRYSLDVDGLSRRNRALVEQEIIRPLAGTARSARVPYHINAA